MRPRELAIVARNLLVGGHLAALAMAKSPRRMVHYITECLFLRRCMDQGDGLPQKAIWDAFETADFSLVMYSDAINDWFISLGSFMSDIVALCATCRIVRPQRIFEIGTFHGTSALHFAANSPDAEVYTLDLPVDGNASLSTTEVDRSCNSGYVNAKKMWFDGRPEAQRIRRLFGDSATFDFTPYRGKIDFFFVDGAHSYEYVRSDTYKALYCTHVGSIIAWHDYGRVGFNGVSRWLHEFTKQGNKIYRTPGGSLAYMRVEKRHEAMSHNGDRTS